MNGRRNLRVCHSFPSVHCPLSPPCLRRLDGSTNRIQRMIDIEVFNKPNSDVFIYILCTRAGGLGVNLQTADTLVLYDSDWWVWV